MRLWLTYELVRCESTRLDLVEFDQCNEMLRICIVSLIKDGGLITSIMLDSSLYSLLICISKKIQSILDLKRGGRSVYETIS